MTSSDNEKVKQSLIIINNWRTNHLSPLKRMKNRLDRLCFKENITPHLISFRLKRMSSIQYKLDLNPSMGLGGMHDIGGYRAVLKNVEDFEKLKSVLEKKNGPHKLINSYDYINPPKDSGYRGIHYVYEYKSSSKKFNRLKIELQIRTKLQHHWATAVETVGLITKTSLKSSMGSEEWLGFFKVVSSLFAIKEQQPKLEIHEDKTMEELMVECYKLSSKLNVIEKLKAIRTTTKYLERTKFHGDYYLINIDMERRMVDISIYLEKSLEEASNRYIEIEKEIKNTDNAVVLVSAKSIKKLKEAYPSYFLDTTEFITNLRKIRENCIRLNLV